MFLTKWLKAVFAKEVVTMEKARLNKSGLFESEKVEVHVKVLKKALSYTMFEGLFFVVGDDFVLVNVHVDVQSADRRELVLAHLAHVPLSVHI